MPDIVNKNRQQWPGNTENWIVADNNIDSQKVFEPQTDYNSQYPYNHVTSYRSGFTFEVDETPGIERYRFVHPNGSYIEYQHDGKVVYRANNNSYEVIAGDQNVRVKGTVNIHVDGGANIKIGGDVNLETSGNIKGKIGGNLEADISGSTTLKSGNDITIVSGGNIALTSSKLTHNNIDIGSDHVHKDVTPGPSLTGPPA